MKEIITTGKTIEEAKKNAAEELNVSVDEIINYEVLDIPKSGILGIGAKPARILVKYGEPAQAQEKEVKSEEKKPFSEKKPMKTLADFEPEKIKNKTGENAEIAEKSDRSERRGRARSFERREKFEKPERRVTELKHSDIFKDEQEEGFVPNEQVEPFLENYLKELFKLMGCENVTFTLERKGKYIYIDLKGDGSGVLIGKRGDTLDAIQQLVQLALNKALKSGEKIRVDTEGYREKRTKTLVTLAKSIANRVIKSRGKYELEPMKAYERKIIHATLQSYPMLTTYSVGVEPERRLVVAFKGRNNYNNIKED